MAAHNAAARTALIAGELERHPSLGDARFHLRYVRALFDCRRPARRRAKAATSTPWFHTPSYRDFISGGATLLQGDVS